jgi:hypothetical protein
MGDHDGLESVITIGWNAHPTQAAAGKLAQERGPERLGFGRTDVHAEHLAPAKLDTHNGHEFHFA